MSAFRVLVCVTRQKNCEHLIREAVALASAREDGEVAVVHVAEEKANFLGIPAEAEAIEYLYRASKAANAEMTILRARDPLEALVDFVRSQDVQVVVTGVASGKGGAKFAQNLRLRLPRVQVYAVVGQE